MQFIFFSGDSIVFQDIFRTKALPKDLHHISNWIITRFFSKSNRLAGSTITARHLRAVNHHEIYILGCGSIPKRDFLINNRAPR